MVKEQGRARNGPALKAVEDGILWPPFLSWEVFLLHAPDSLRQYHKILYFTAPIKNSKVL
jgi:hypothetical protein